MTFIIGLVLAAIFLLATIAIFATKAFFPYHRVVALVVYALGWIPFLYSLSLRKQWILKNQDVVMPFLHGYWVHMLFGLVMLGSIYVIVTLFPPTQFPFRGLSDDQIQHHIEEDQTIILYLNEQLAGTLTNAQKEGVFTMDFNKVSGVEKEALEDSWISLIEVMIQLDILKERYKSFYQLNALTKNSLHRQAFINAYASFLSQHYYVLQLQRSAIDPNVHTFLNQARPEHGIEQGTFDLLIDKLTDAGELLRLNTGRAYYSFIKDDGSNLGGLIASHLSIVDESLREYAHLLAKKPLNFLERHSFKLWFPVQKQVAVQISFVRTSTRDYHIKPEHINQYRDQLEPGDIFVERREWHATNVGIPGFWTHAALYIGTLEHLDKVFGNLSELKGQTFSHYIEQRYPQAYAQMQGLDENGYEYAVIEAKRPGVILASLEYTANADSFGVLRVKNLTDADRFKIVTQAFSHLGKPYDFDFNFVTDDALVCSELVYKSYLDISQFSMTPQQVNGRPLISPNQFAEKYAQEFGTPEAQLEFILFLDGNEKTGEAVKKGPDIFIDAYKRPKWHIAKDFVNFQ